VPAPDVGRADATEEGPAQAWKTTLRRDWDRNETAAGMRWDEAKLAVRDAWDRITDHDGR
jgi:hypothetical protein